MKTPDFQKLLVAPKLESEGGPVRQSLGDGETSVIAVGSKDVLSGVISLKPAV